MHRPGPRARANTWRNAIRDSAAVHAHIRVIDRDLEVGTSAADDARKLGALRVDLCEKARSLQGACRLVYPWLATIRKLIPELTTSDVLSTYGIVAANALELRTPVSGARYGLALYSASAHMRHSCTPSARVVVGEHGRLRVLATRALKKDDVISLNRFVPCFGFIRCIQTAPRAVRNGFDSVVGGVCRCDECRECLDYFRSLVAAKRLPDAGPGASPPVASDGDIAIVERAVESTWQTSAPSNEARAFVATLDENAPLREVLRSPLLLLLSPEAIGDTLENEESLAALFPVLVERSLLAVALAHAILVNVHTGYRAADDDIVRCAAATLDIDSVVVLERVLREQRASESLIAERRRTWRAHVTYLTEYSRETPRARVLYTRLVNAIRNVDVVDDDEPADGQEDREVVEQMFIEQLYTPGLALRMEAYAESLASPSTGAALAE
jgi:hypothetical protein